MRHEAGYGQSTNLIPEPAHVVCKASVDRDTPVERQTAQAGIVGQQAEGVSCPDNTGIAHGNVAAPVLDQHARNVGDAGATPGSAIDNPKCLLLRQLSYLGQQPRDITDV